MTTRRILITEDESIVAQDLADILNDFGYSVADVASTAEEAIEIAEKKRPDLVLMDIELGGKLDGISAAEIIGSRFRIPVVFITAYADDDRLQRAKKTEPYGYILKPFQDGELKAVLEVTFFRNQIRNILERNNRFLKSLLHGSKPAIISVDTDGIIDFVNPVAEKLTGWGAAEVAGKNIDEVLCLFDRNNEKTSVIKSVGTIDDNRASKTFGTIFLETKNTSRVSIDSTIFLRKNESGRTLGSIIIFQDSESLRAAETGLDHIPDDGLYELENQTKSLHRSNFELQKRIKESQSREQQLESAIRDLETFKNRLQEENLYLKESVKLHVSDKPILTISSRMNEILITVEQVAATDTTVLILGETGTGKELLARKIHSDSHRKDYDVVTVNCATLPANLIESELFGYEKGAFSGANTRKPGQFEIADKGTIILDEIGELPLELQPKLLRVLQEGEYHSLGSIKSKKIDVRIVASTNRDLQLAVQEGKFRKDLYYRLNVFPISLPPLRHRKEDIPLLVRYLVHVYSQRIGKKINVIPLDTMATLHSYAWPGNIRELENVIERSVILARDGVLNVDFLADNRLEPAITTSSSTLETMERTHIRQILEDCSWTVEGENGAAHVLGLPASTLRSRMKRFAISRPETI